MIKIIGYLLISLTLAGCFGGGAVTRSVTQQRLTDLQQRAQISADKGFYDDARRLLQEALQLAGSLDDRQGQAAVLVQQARLARQNNQQAQAGQAVAQALNLSVGSDLHADAAQEKALQELAAGRTDQALNWAEIALREERGDRLARRLNLLARLALLQGRTTDAANLAEQALKKSGAEPMAAERANALRMLGTVRGQQQRYAEGEQLLGQALELDKQLELPDRIAADLEALAVVAALRGDQVRQQDYRHRAQTVMDSLIKRRKTPGTPQAGQNR